MNWKDELVGQVPIAFLGIALLALLCPRLPLPQPNHDIALAIVSGVLGYIQGRPKPPGGGQ